MSVFPDIITEVPAAVPLQWGASQQVLITEFDNGVENRRATQASPRREIEITYSPANFDKALLLWNFYNARHGSLESFAFFFPQIARYEKEFVGSAFGGEITARLPSRDSLNQSLYRNGVLLTQLTSYTISYRGGPDGEDLAVFRDFTAEPGDHFHYSFHGRLKIKARFTSDPYKSADVKNLFSVVGIKLLQLEPVL